MASVLEASRQQAGLTVAALWLASVANGWAGAQDDLAGVLRGARVPTPGEYDVIAQALNDRFADLGHDHPVPYAEDL